MTNISDFTQLLHWTRFCQFLREVFASESGLRSSREDGSGIILCRPHSSVCIFLSSFYKCILFSAGVNTQKPALPCPLSGQTPSSPCSRAAALLLRQEHLENAAAAFIYIQARKNQVVLLGTKPKLVNRSPLVPSDGDGFTLLFCSTEHGLVCK